jgi:hypothetical protein
MLARVLIDTGSCPLIEIHSSGRDKCRFRMSARAYSNKLLPSVIDPAHDNDKPDCHRFVYGMPSRVAVLDEDVTISWLGVESECRKYKSPSILWLFEQE